MARNKAELLQGTLELLILKTLTLEPMHGYGVSKRIEQVTRGVFDVKPGSLFPALHRLEQRGAIVGEWGESANKRRAKYYRLTAKGKKQLAEERQNWKRQAAAIVKVLQVTQG